MLLNDEEYDEASGCLMGMRVDDDEGRTDGKFRLENGRFVLYIFILYPYTIPNAHTHTHTHIHKYTAQPL